MDKRRLVLIVAGVLAILVGYTADMVGLGAEPALFGWKQKILIILGGVVVGYALGSRTTPSKEEESKGE